MSVLFFWEGKQYSRDMETQSDMSPAKTYQLNHSNELIINLKLGEHIWAFTRKNGTYVLALDLFVLTTEHNEQGKHWQYCAIGDEQKSHYFAVSPQIDIESEIRSIFPQAKSITKTGKRCGLGSFFQGTNGVRLLDSVDEQRLKIFSRSIPLLC